MIFGKIESLNNYQFNNENMEVARKYLLDNDILKMEHKRHVILENEIFINFLDFDQQPFESREYEAHNQFVDIHITLLGNDFIRSTHKDNLTVTSEYNEAEDYLMGVYSGNAFTDSHLPFGYFGLYFPEDAHLVNGTMAKPENIKKFVMKIKVK